jgi:hypothetical protein
LEVEAAAGGPELSQTSVSVEEARPELLLGVAGALKQRGQSFFSVLLVR